MQCLFDTGADNEILSNYDGAVYDVAVGGDCVCGGIGDEFTISYSPSSLRVTFTSGSEAIIGGAFFKVTDSEYVDLEANSSNIYLCATINKTKADGHKASFEQRTEQSIMKGNLNGNDTTRDLLLYKIKTNSSGVVSVEDKRVIRTSGSTQVGGLTLWTGTQAEYDAIPSKDSQTIYFIKES